MVYNRAHTAIGVAEIGAHNLKEHRRNPAMIIINDVGYKAIWTVSRIDQKKMTDATNVNINEVGYTAQKKMYQTNERKTTDATNVNINEVGSKIDKAA